MYGQRPSTATDPQAWLDALPEPRRTELRVLHDRVAAVAPGLAASARVERQFLAYGHYQYRYPAGREGDWFPLSLASGAQYISVYVPPTTDLEPLVARLPKANMGKACIRFRKVDQIDLEVIDEVIRAAADADGKRFTWDKDGTPTVTPIG
jgi:hypothetical protein